MTTIRHPGKISLSFASAMTLLLLHGVVLCQSPAHEDPPRDPAEEARELPMPAGALVGVVTGPGGTPVLDASVSPQSLDRPGNPISQIGIITDVHGRYRWVLVPGQYAITVYREGFQRATQTITLAPGEPARLDFVLDPAP